MLERSQMIKKLQESFFDLLIIGGGASGAGAALDAASRGLKVALVEKNDFAAGTSSRSTKLIHGGVRYLELAVKQRSREQYQLVKDALRERATLLKIAPHLSRPIPLVTPIYSLFGGPYFWTGLKMYDRLAGKRSVGKSKYLSRKKAIKRFPMLKAKGLKGGVLYYDGQFDDARMNVTLIRTAIDYGATALNHIEVIGLIKENTHLSGAKVKDIISEKNFDIKARVIINATGPFCDKIRFMDDPQARSILRASSGIHIVLDKRFSPPHTGLLIPETEDGRVLFLLPWLGHTLVGTTDNPANIEDNPHASEQDIEYLLRHVVKYFNIPVTRQDVLSSWSGLRPLVSDPNFADTAKLSRDHVINISPSGLITLTGGKWTTYRKMAEDVINQAITLGSLTPTHACQSENILLKGSQSYSEDYTQKLVDSFHIDEDIAKHLATSYGTESPQVLQIGAKQHLQRLSKDYPYIEAEILYAIHEELACNAVDILARRMRLAFLNQEVAKEALPLCLKILKETFQWSNEQMQEEEKKFLDYLSL
ncbi:MAG: FAD-dependent oxidoreductase [Deltaproteobacteria bacterium]|nr:FAD-dependent oxidoreductase [Deltaproteobacteria bacterium]